MDSSALIDRLGSFSAETLKNDAAARKEALGLSRMLTSSLQEPLNETTEIMISVSSQLSTYVQRTRYDP